MRSGGCGSWTGWKGASATYTIPLALRLRGALDRAALEAALGDLVERHESLRTIFPDTLGVPRQEILDAGAARPRLAVTAVSEGSLAGALSAAAGAGFDLAREPPLRVHLFALGESEHVLLLLLHHIAGDGWSLAPLLRDLGRFYEARCRGQAAAVGGAAGAICRLHAVAACGSGLGGGWGERDCAPAVVLDAASWRGFRISSIFRSTVRVLRCRAIAGGALGCGCLGRCTLRLLELARASGASLFMVLQAGLERAADAAWCGQRHCDREPDCGSHRQRAGRSCRVLREHAGAAHGHVWGIRASASWLGGCVRAILRPTATRSFRSSGWWRCSTLRARCRVIRCSR